MRKAWSWFVVTLLAAGLMPLEVWAMDGLDGPSSASLVSGNVRVHIAGHSGKIIFRIDDDATPPTDSGDDGIDGEDDGGKKFTLEFSGLYEQTPAGEVVDDHIFHTFANQDFAFSDLLEFGFPGFDEGTTVTSKNIDFTTWLMVDGVLTTLTVQNFLFTTTGTITVDGEAFPVKDGHLKFTVDIEGWPFSDPANELVLEMAVKTPGQTPEIAGS